MTKKTVSTRILEKIAACEQHDHSPKAIVITTSLAIDLVNEMYGYNVKCWNSECEHEECNSFRDSLTRIPGYTGLDEKWAELVGIPLFIRSDQEEIEVIEE